MDSVYFRSFGSSGCYIRRAKIFGVIAPGSANCSVDHLYLQAERGDWKGCCYLEVRRTVGRPHLLSCCLIDDNVDILTELEAILATDRATGTHIKLSKKRRLPL